MMHTAELEKSWPFHKEDGSEQQASLPLMTNDLPVCLNLLAVMGLVWDIRKPPKHIYSGS